MKPKRPKPKPLREWTIMVYMSGDNSLSAECVWALTEMKKAAGSDNINIIVQFDPSDDFIQTKRYEINKNGVLLAKGSAPAPPKPLADDETDRAAFNPRTGEVHFRHESSKADILANKRQEDARYKLLTVARKVSQGEGLNADLPPDLAGSDRNDTNAASPITLYNFLSFGVQFYPARHYMVVLSGHSAGIQPNYLLRDDSSGAYMTFMQLKTVFEQLQLELSAQGRLDERGRVIDILGFDTCLMSMAEICFELRGLVQTVIGSESYTPASGWPYFLILDTLSRLGSSSQAKPQTKTKALTPAQFARAIVEEYVQYYKDYVTGGVSVALSALDVTQSTNLIPLVKRLANVLMRELTKEHPEEKRRRRNQMHPFTDALLLAHWEAQSYNGELYVDLVDFCECLSRRYRKGSVPAACEAVIKHVRDRLVLKSCFSGPAYQYSNGASIYFPWASVAPFLFTFEFAKQSGWGDFLEMYTNVTRRSFRQPENPTAKQRKQIERLESVGGNSLTHVRMGSDKMGSDKMGSDKMGSDKMGSDKMGSDKSGNPIHSMRNPPIAAIDLDC